MDLYFSWVQRFEVTNVLMLDLFLTNEKQTLLFLYEMLNDELEWCGLL